LSPIGGGLPDDKIPRFERTDNVYRKLLMSTGLTFGTISALFALSHGLIDQKSVLSVPLVGLLELRV